MVESEREEGFYKMLSGSEGWIVAEYANSEFWRCGYEDPIKDNDIVEIGEKIELP